MPTTPNLGLEYPAAGAAPNVPLDLQKLAESVDSLGSSWTSYTPGLGAGWTLGNGAAQGYFKAIGKTVFYAIFIRIGSTTRIVAPSLGIVLPVTRVHQAAELVGRVYLNDTSVTTAAGTAFGDAVVAAASTSTLTVFLSTGAPFTQTTPWTWAAGDTLMIRGEYQSA